MSLIFVATSWSAPDVVRGGRAGRRWGSQDRTSGWTGRLVGRGSASRPVLSSTFCQIAGHPPAAPGSTVLPGPSVVDRPARSKVIDTTGGVHRLVARSGEETR